MKTVQEEFAELTEALRNSLQWYGLQGGGWFPEGLALPVSEETEETEAYVEPTPQDAEQQPTSSPWAQLATQARSKAEESQGGPAQVRAAMGSGEPLVLHEEAGFRIQGAGHPAADLLVIGIQPEAEGQAPGEPLSGEVGEMFDKMLRHVLALGRDDIYLVDAVQEKGADDLQAVGTYLRSIVQVVRPRLVFIQGATGAKALLGRGDLKNMQGETFDVEGAETIASLHPAYLFSKPEWKRWAFEDLKRVRARYDEVTGRG